MSEFPEVTYACTFGMTQNEKRPDLIVKVWDQDSLEPPLSRECMKGKEKASEHSPQEAERDLD